MKNVSIEEFDIESDYESKVKAFLQIINAKSSKEIKSGMDASFEEESKEKFNILFETTKFFTDNIVNYLNEWAQPDLILSLLFHYFTKFFIKYANEETKNELTFDALYTIFNSAVNQLRITYPEILIKVESNIDISSNTFDVIIKGLNQAYINPNWINISNWKNLLKSLDFKEELREMILFVEFLLFQKKEINKLI
ncbi:MAG: hypothetical protein ACFFDH_04520 [Promethearchaeota archaeon]